jgi:hypothetical protein
MSIFETSAYSVHVVLSTVALADRCKKPVYNSSGIRCCHGCYLCRHYFCNFIPDYEGCME